jgi:TetR/AcrR family transcriptional regulator, repressor for uid operon
VRRTEPTRLRIIEAAYDCICRQGLAAVTLDASAQQAGVARATVYRHFPGGRDELVSAVVGWEVARFFAGVRADIGDAPDFAEYLERGLAAAHRRLQAHEVLQHALEEEAGSVLPPLANVMPLVVGVLSQHFAVRLADEDLAPGVEVGDTADLLARMVLSHIGSPGAWDLDDPERVRRFVRDWLLAGVLAPERTE